MVQKTASHHARGSKPLDFAQSVGTLDQTLLFPYYLGQQSLMKKYRPVSECALARGIIIAEIISFPILKRGSRADKNPVSTTCLECREPREKTQRIKALEASKPCPSEQRKPGWLRVRKPDSLTPWSMPLAIILGRSFRMCRVKRRMPGWVMGLLLEEPSASGRWPATSSCKRGTVRRGAILWDGIKRALVTGVKGKHAARKGGAPPVGLREYLNMPSKWLIGLDPVQNPTATMRASIFASQANQFRGSGSCVVVRL